jgi:hypothetical protein
MTLCTTLLSNTVLKADLEKTEGAVKSGQLRNMSHIGLKS